MTRGSQIACTAPVGKYEASEKPAVQQESSVQGEQKFSFVPGSSHSGSFILVEIWFRYVAHSGSGTLTHERGDFLHKPRPGSSSVGAGVPLAPRPRPRAGLFFGASKSPDAWSRGVFHQAVKLGAYPKHPSTVVTLTMCVLGRLPGDLFLPNEKPRRAEQGRVSLICNTYGVPYKCVSRRCTSPKCIWAAGGRPF